MHDDPVSEGLPTHVWLDVPGARDWFRRSAHAQQRTPNSSGSTRELFDGGVRFWAVDRQVDWLGPPAFSRRPQLPHSVERASALTQQPTPVLLRLAQRAA